MSDKTNESINVGLIKHNNDYGLPTEENLMRLRSLSSENQMLHSENDKLRAKLARIEHQALISINNWRSSRDVFGSINTLLEILKENPSESITHIQAAAVWSAIDSCVTDLYSEWVKVEDLKFYIRQLWLDGQE